MNALWNQVKSPSFMAIVALISLIFTFYQEFREKQPKILIETLGIASVFNVTQQVGGLQISYGGEDLRSTQKSLWVINAEGS
jgi:hypothetical protein